MNKILLFCALELAFCPAGRGQTAPVPQKTGQIWTFVLDAAKGTLVLRSAQNAQPLAELAAKVQVHRLLGRPEHFETKAPSAEAMGPLLWGECKAGQDELQFHPAAPLVLGEFYFVGIRAADGDWSAWEILSPALNATGTAVGVKVSPVSNLPANALKVYLTFSTPMEQGVMLEKLHLMDDEAQPVSGPFRETELWSPDGRRLTVWFHPGRQKTAVQLGEDEGPVLRPQAHYELIVDGSWRTTTGKALGANVSHNFATTAVDHQSPDPSSWRVTTHQEAMHTIIHVQFDEPLDAEMIPSALSLSNHTGPIAARCEAAANGSSATLTTDSILTTGSYVLHIDPLLEDLAGNNLQHPFEVDLSQKVIPKEVILELKVEIRD